MILVLRTDNPEAEIGLYDGDKQLVYETWQAHRQLAETLHQQIETKLQSINKEWGDIKGVVVYRGPGSFTGLRIGIATVNALAHSLGMPIVGVGGDDWVRAGIERLQNGESDKTVLPVYGAPVHITQQKK